MVKLNEIKTWNQAYWIMTQRNRPELYKYFRQDKPITEAEQKKWFKYLDRSKIRGFVVENMEGDWVGYVGFNPLNLYAMRGEFGVFIVPEHEAKGYAKEALLKLLTLGFCEMGLRTIYSDCLEYPGEDRFGFYKSLGFVKHPPEWGTKRYKKQGKWIESTSFYMSFDMFEKKHGDRANTGKLEAWGKAAALTKLAKAALSGTGVHTGPSNLNPFTK